MYTSCQLRDDVVQKTISDLQSNIHSCKEQLQSSVAEDEEALRKKFENLATDKETELLASVVPSSNSKEIENGGMY